MIHLILTRMNNMNTLEKNKTQALYMCKLSRSCKL